MIGLEAYHDLKLQLVKEPLKTPTLCQKFIDAPSEKQLRDDQV
jgi:hypothetical protein